MTAECGAVNPAAKKLLEQLLAPVSLSDFVSASWERQFLHVPGKKGKFAGLFDWEQVNSLLNSHRFPPPRLRLCRGGKFADPSKYQRGNGLLLTEPLLDEVRNGSTLIVSGVDEVNPRCREITAAVQQTFRCHCNINVFVSLKAVPGFPAHFDYHGIFVAQVAGRKHWRVWKPSIPNPLREHERELSAPKDRPPYWEGTLEPGSFLHLPRGWWHEAHAADEPSLHLTACVRPQTGGDFLQWAAAELRRNEFFRRDVPRFAESEQREYVNELVQTMQTALGEDAVERFLEESSARLRSFPRFDLPGTD